MNKIDNEFFLKVGPQIGDYGNEPSLIGIINFYYQASFPPEKANHLTNEYINHLINPK